MTTEQKVTIEDVLTSPCASYWLKNALKSALQRDEVDAYYDAKLLAELLNTKVHTNDA